MALDPLAKTSDVAAVFRPLTDSEDALADGLIAQASMRLRLVARRRGADLSSLMQDELTAEAVTAAVVNAVKRVLMNPDAIRQLSTTTGPMSESRTIDAAVSSGLLYLDDSDLDDIFPSAPKSLLRSFRVRPGMR